MTNTQLTTNPRRLARVAGLLYLLNGILGGFALLFVYAKVYVPGNAATTASNLVANSGLVRAGVVADLVQATIWVFLALTLYRLLTPASRSAAGAMVVFVAIGAGIVMLNEVFGFEALRVATAAVSMTSAGAGGSNAVALMLVDAQHYGILIAQVFFGLWLLPLGYLVYRSGWFPRLLGMVLILGAVGYLADTLAGFLVPDLDRAMHSYITIPSAIAEIWTLGYLLVIGVRLPTRVNRTAAVA
jgi:uncharacterized protein DUF4386